MDHVTRVGLWMNLLLTGALAVLVALLAPWAVAAHPSKVYPGRKWVFWQYSGSGLSKGLKGRIDLNVFHGSEAAWHDWVAG